MHAVHVQWCYFLTVPASRNSAQTGYSVAVLVVLGLASVCHLLPLLAVVCIGLVLIVAADVHLAVLVFVLVVVVVDLSWL